MSRLRSHDASLSYGVFLLTIGDGCEGVSGQSQRMPQVLGRLTRLTWFRFASVYVCCTRSKAFDHNLEICFHRKDNSTGNEP